MSIQKTRKKRPSRASLLKEIRRLNEQVLVLNKTIGGWQTAKSKAEGEAIVLREKLCHAENRIQEKGAETEAVRSAAQRKIEEITRVLKDVLVYNRGSVTYRPLPALAAPPSVLVKHDPSTGLTTAILEGYTPSCESLLRIG